MPEPDWGLALKPFAGWRWVIKGLQLLIQVSIKGFQGAGSLKEELGGDGEKFGRTGGGIRVERTDRAAVVDRPSQGFIGVGKRSLPLILS